jgi:divalent metal cation (Fe/Co/Zn/Cd) transporter
VEFVEGLPAEEIHTAIHRMERRIRGHHPEVKRIYIEVEAVARGSRARPDVGTSAQKDGTPPASTS